MSIEKLGITRLTEEERESLKAKELEETKKIQDQHNAEFVKYSLEVCNVPKRYFTATLEPISDEQGQVIDKISKALHSTPTRDVLLLGGVGVGKTHIACAIVLKFNHAMLFSKYITEFELFELYSQKKYGFFEGFKQAKFLVIDEIGKHDSATWQRAQLEEVISYRYDNELPTMYLSNLNADAFKAYVGDRASDRMRGNNVSLIVMGGDSLRSTAKINNGGVT